MSFKSTLIGAVSATLLALPAFAADVEVHDAYAISSGGPNGAAFMVIENTGETDLRVVGVRSDLAARTELHTHVDEGNGVMRMRHVEEGFDLPAGSELVLERGGNHVMFMGVSTPFIDGEEIEIILVLDTGEEIAVTPVVDNNRMPMGHGGTMNHGN
ncbi:copper chaperone PCu(A)C [Loktanella sp. IMCC34160]|uniref:copper chaperone PCu(A)C n=1 Tax=Loktanella sp. IMCC34160 TaxID=2510646 RepID=UPI00101BF5F2|nr:copper chaperone PCu(A)C [Loktanella sp. IMCC34160]RYG90830.1 copper chaperone PCu(A)C [Loktanella sp. IMCC34160]